MSEAIDLREPKRRVIKAPAVRRAELLDCAQRLFLTKGYEKTTINDVIAAAGLSKGAFYHHFTAKEDLLEAIAQGFSREAMSSIAVVQEDASLNALQRLNMLLAMSREWKIEHLPQLRAMFTVLLRPENAVLYHRIVAAVFAVMGPTIASIIEQGVDEGIFDVVDPMTAAEALLGLGEGRRSIVVRAMAAAEAGDVDGATEVIMRRVRAEEQIIDRILGLAPGGVDLAGSAGVIRAMLEVWSRPSGGDYAGRS